MYVDVVFHFQNFLDAFTEAAETVYGCLLVEGKVAVATKKWWSLTANELVLLRMLVLSLSDCTSRDLPVFLPDSHPTVSIWVTSLIIPSHAVWVYTLYRLYVFVRILFGPSWNIVSNLSSVCID